MLQFSGLELFIIGLILGGVFGFLLGDLYSYRNIDDLVIRAFKKKDYRRKNDQERPKTI